MKRAVVLLILTTIASTTIAAERSRFVVGVDTRVPGARLRAIALAAKDDARERNLSRYDTLDGFAVDLTEAEAEELRRSGQVLYVDPVVERHISSEDAAFRPAPFARPRQAQSIPWGLEAVHARDVWPYTRGDGQVNVVVADTGIDATHPELAAKYAGGYNVFTKKEDPIDDHYHGTHVSGTIAAADNDIGIVGISPNVRLWAVKVLAKNGFGSDETIAASIDWAIAKKRQLGGRWIMNFSLGSLNGSRFEAAAVRRGDDEGILIIAAAGNRSLSSVDYPGGHPGAVAVAALDQNDERARFSSFGTGLQLSAPGVGIPSTVPVGSVSVADVELTDGRLLPAIAHIGGPIGEINAELVNCGIGRPEDFPEAVRGKIALIARDGAIQFRTKSRRAKEAGAIGVIIYNGTGMREDMGVWTLLACDGTLCEEDKDFAFPLTLGVNVEVGQLLLERVNSGKSVQASLSHRKDDYDSFNGTSMATPHVAAVAALLWSLAPNATSEQIRLVLKHSARDLGPQGWDMNFGYGAIDALAAAKMIAPQVFGLPPAPLPSDPRRRSSPPR